MTEQQDRTLEEKIAVLERCLASCQAELETTRTTLAQERGARREVERVLNERHKELTCLYDLSKLGERPDLSLPKLLQAIVDRLPAAWQYPEIAGTQLTYHGQTYQTSNFEETPWQQRSPLMHDIQHIGELTICYTEERPREVIGPFLAEEQELLEAVAEYVDRIIERRETTAQLQASEERFRRAMLAAPFPMMIHAEDGSVLQINHVWTELTGYTQEEIPTIGDWTERAYGERQEVVKAHIDQLYDHNERTQEGKYEIITKWGEKRIWEFNSAPLGATLNGRRQVLSIATDVTERQRAEKALRQERDRAQQYLDIAGVIFLALDATGNVTLINQKGSEVLGYAQQEIIGKNWFDNFLPARTREEVRGIFARLMAGETEPVEYYESYIITQAGEERIISWHNTVLRDEGQIIGTLGSGEDITERQRAEIARRETNARLANILESISDGFFALNDQLIVTYFNQAAEQLLGRSKEEVLGQPIFEAFPEAKGSIFEEKYTQALRERTPLVFEVYFEADPYTNWYNARVYPYEAGISVYFQVTTEHKQAEAALRESEERFRLIAEHAQDLIYRIRLYPDQQFEYVSPSATKITGFTPAEHYADPNLGYKLVHPEDRPKLQQTAQAPTDEPLVLRWVRKDGRVIWTEQQNTPIYDDEGRMVALEGIARDITARKETELALRRVNRALRVISECNQILVRTDDEALLMNDICQALVDFGEYRLAWVGYAIETEDGTRIVEPTAWAAEGTPWEEYIDHLHVRWDDESEHGQGPTGRAVRTGTHQIVRNIETNGTYGPWRTAASHGLTSSIALPLIIDDKSIGALNLYIDNVNAFDPEEIKLLLELASDLSYGIQALRTHKDRERVQSELRALYETINRSPVIAFQSTPTPPWDATYISKNIRQFGYTPADFYNGHIFYADLIHPADRERVTAEIKYHIQQHDEHFAQEYRICTREGEMRWVDDRTWVHRTSHDEILGFHGIILDVTERHEMAQQLQRYAESLEEQVAEKVRDLEEAQVKIIQTAKLASLGEMATGVAHELNQPLTSMLFDADYLRSWAQKAQKADDGQCPVDFNEIYQIGEDFISDIDRCRRITDYLRSFRRLTRGEPIRFDLNQAIAGSLTLAHARLIQHGIEFHRDLTQNLPSIYAHPGQIEHVFLNLIHNAERALAEMSRRIEAGEVQRPDYQKRLIISTWYEDEGKYVIATVHDNGCGIPPAAQKQLFQPFFTTRAFGEGTGLGLTISHSIVKEFNGEINVKSTENAGTTFILRFPIADKD